jgi:RHS repeat-associated protein
VYDAFGRRRIRREKVWKNSQWMVAAEVRYVYDGMLVIQERDGNNIPTVSYTRGRDLGGGRQTAGGIGGLLALTQPSAFSPQHFYYHSDGNGNVTSLLDSHQTVAARYQYDPFGNLLGLSGSMADANLYRFSSKEAHGNSGLYYYGYRFYEPGLQRWLNQDPIGEWGGLNLYGFVSNQVPNWLDLWGLSEGDADDWLDLPDLGDCPTASTGKEEDLADGKETFKTCGKEAGKGLLMAAGTRGCGKLFGRLSEALGDWWKVRKAARCAAKAARAAKLIRDRALKDAAEMIEYSLRHDKKDTVLWLRQRAKELGQERVREAGKILAWLRTHAGEEGGNVLQELLALLQNL